MFVSSIYTETKDLLQTRRRIVHQGGQSSGKTVNILGAIADVVAREPKIATVTSMSFPHLKAGAMRDFERFVMPSFSDAIKQYRKTDHVALFDSGGLIEFKTYETEFDARGAKRDILFVNEANTFDYMTWFQLDSRSNVSVIDYNPTIRFWAHEKVIDEPGTAFRRSWHEHNPFLTADKHREIENIATFDYDKDGNVKLTKDGKPKILKGDLELWKVYARGITGNVQGVIFSDWTMVEDIEWDSPFFAIDFGYTNDPTAIVKMERAGESIFVEEIAYQTGSMTPRRIKMMLESNGYDNNCVVYCEHDGDMIKQLRLLGVNAIAARKGAGSIKAGIEKLKEYKVYYKGRNLKTELSMYIWVVDKEGRTTNVPIDANNHLIDATRYGAYTHFYRRAA